jgi:hypothetical protein
MLQFIAAMLVFWPLLWVTTVVLHKLVVGETHAKFGPALTANVISYGLGPAMLAIIPFIGPPLAAVWSITAMIIGGRRRLGLGPKGAVICVILSVLAAAAAAIILYLAVWLCWWYWDSWGLPAFDTLDMRSPMRMN